MVSLSQALKTITGSAGPAGLVADRFQESEAIHDGHHQIEQDEVGGPVVELVESFAAVGCGLRVEATQLEESSHGFAAVGLIIDNQNTLHTAGGQDSFGDGFGNTANAVNCLD